MPGLQIRPRVDADVAACVRLMRQTHLGDRYPRFWPAAPEAFLVDPAEVAAWVAEVDGAVVGHVALHDAAGHVTLPAARRATGRSPDQLAVLARLLVDPTVRGAGLGRGLHDVALAYVADRGQRGVLDVVTDDPALERRYQRWGWVRLEPLTITAHSGDLLDLWVYLAPEPG